MKLGFSLVEAFPCLGVQMLRCGLNFLDFRKKRKSGVELKKKGGGSCQLLTCMNS